MKPVYPRGNLVANTNRGPSPAIWADCPVNEIIDNPEKGFHFFDDFGDRPTGLITSPTTEAALVGIPYNGFGSSGATITFSNEAGGAVVLTEVTDNEAVYLRAKSGMGQISAGKGKLWFEGRVKIGAVSDDNMGFIFGLWDDVTLSVVVPLSTANPPIMATTGNFVGFRAPEEDAGVVRTMYDSDDAGQTTDAEVIVQAGVHTFVADTYVKFGMCFDPDGFGQGLGPLLRYYVNGVNQTGTKVIPDNTGTDFPADVRFTPLIGHRMGATASSGVTTMDWWRYAQIFR